MVFSRHYLAVANRHLSIEGLWTGVDLFFVLSGFLITGILFDSKSSQGYFRNFYIRRALRILPIFYGFFLMALVLTPILHLQYSSYLWTNVLYLGNLFIPGSEMHLHGDPTSIIVPHLPGAAITVGHLWSLCIEEQFYLVWPLVVWLVRSRRRLLYLCSFLIVFTFVLRIYLFFHSSTALLATDFLYNATFTRCDTLLIGAWLALWLRGVEISRLRLNRIASHLFGWNVGILFVAVTLRRLLRFESNGPIFQTVGYTMIGLAAAGVLMYALDEKSHLHRFLLKKWFVNLGRISYGFYFFHKMPIAQFKVLTVQVLRPHYVSFLILPIAFGYAYGAAWLSFRYLESPFLRLKKVLAPEHRAGMRGEDPSFPPPSPAVPLSS
jgi:peptidoglycan/LPS O-acetylase OafA/YrhL